MWISSLWYVRNAGDTDVNCLMLNLNFTPFPILETERLLLRPITIADAPEIFFMRNNEEHNRYTGGPRAHTMDDALAFIDKISNNTSNNEAIMWGITLKGEEKLAGSICYWNIIPEKDQAELGYGLMKDYRGRGVMNETLQKVMAYGWEVMKLKTMEAYTDENNEPSRKLLERNNFKLDENMEQKKAAQNELESCLIYVLKAEY